MPTALSNLGPIKLYGLLQRRLDLTLSDFSEHWKTTHKIEAEKLSSFFSAYIQNHRLALNLPGYPVVCDGAPEIWFRSAEDLIAMRMSAEYETGAYVDELNFMHGRASGLVVSERTIRAGPIKQDDEKSVRVTFFIRKSADISEDAFSNWCATHDAPAIDLQVPPSRHVRGKTLPSDEQPLYDAVESYWWQSEEEALAALSDGALGLAARSVIDQRSCGILCSTELPVKWPTSGVDYSS